MGEFASYGGKRIKIGTCEDMYYLRADQAHKVQPLSGNVSPTSKEDQEVIRFRFPWPDEDGKTPGDFEDYSRAVAVPGLKDLPGVEFEHYSVQFSAHAGYLVSLPCPESKEGRASPLQVHRNGFAGAFQVVQQAYRGGNLAVILRCGGCGGCFNLPTLEDVAPVVKAFQEEAERGYKSNPDAPDARASFYAEIARRIMAGYITDEMREAVGA